MKDILLIIFTAGFFIFGFIWFLALINPRLSVFSKVKSKNQNRKGLSKIFGVVVLVMFIGVGITAPPVKPELKNLNIKPDEEVVTETYSVEGEVKGSYQSLKINDQDIGLSKGKFSKIIELKPGDNDIKVVLVGKDENELDVEVYNQTHKVFFDYEGMLYAKELEEDKKAEEELQAKLSEVPKYEMVRKSDVDDGFSAIVYIENGMEDYLITNVVKEIKNNNGNQKNLSILLFNKSDKDKAETILEGSSPADLLSHIRANYEKRGSHEDLFWFPEGAGGRKLALEIQ